MYRGMVVREGTIDDNIVRQVWDDYNGLDFENGVKNKIVLDGGAHIGAFTNMALQRGGHRIIAIEPNLENSRIFKMNFSHALPEFFRDALVGGEESESTDFSLRNLYTCGGENQGMHTMIEGAMESRGIFSVGKQKVGIIQLAYLLRAYAPSIIKLDIEGSEIEMFPILLSDKNPASQMAIEFHAFNDEMREANIEFVNQLMNSHPAWEVVKRPMVHKGHQATVGVFRR